MDSFDLFPIPFGQLTEQSETCNALSLNHVAEENGNSQVEDILKSDSEEDLVSVHSIILDWTLVCFIDSVAAKAIKQVQQDTQKHFCTGRYSVIQ